MPTFNEYENDPGYFIRAWTPETGNITYGIRSGGNPIVEDYGLEDEADISWDTINSLKSLGLIYTKESGTIASDDFEPDPEQISETSLTQSESKELFEIIQSHRDLTTDELDEICSILGIESPPVEEFEVTIPLNQKHIGTITNLENEPAFSNMEKEKLAVWVKIMGAIRESEEIQEIETNEKIGEAGYDIAEYLLST
jgi:hypothetical protein